MQPRPVRRASRIMGAAAAVLGIVPTVTTEFNIFDWTSGQLNAYTLTVGTVIGAVSLVMGVQVEKVVTPVTSPKNDSGQQLIPVEDTDPII